MVDRSFLTWPFFEDRHRVLADRLDSWAQANLSQLNHTDTDATCRKLVRMMGDDGWLEYSASEAGTLDVRTL